MTFVILKSTNEKNSWGSPIGVYDTLEGANKTAFGLDIQNESVNYKVLEYEKNTIMPENEPKNLYDFNSLKVLHPELLKTHTSLREEATQKALEDWKEHCLKMKISYIVDKLSNLREEVAWFRANPEKNVSTLKRQRILEDIVKYFDKFDPTDFLDQTQKIDYQGLKSDAHIFSSKRF